MKIPVTDIRRVVFDNLPPEPYNTKLLQSEESFPTGQDIDYEISIENGSALIEHGIVQVNLKDRTKTPQAIARLTISLRNTPQSLALGTFILGSNNEGVHVLGPFAELTGDTKDDFPKKNTTLEFKSLYSSCVYALSRVTNKPN